MHPFTLAIDMLYCSEAKSFIEGDIVRILCFQSDFISLCRKLLNALVYKPCGNTLTLMSLVNENRGDEIGVLCEYLFRLQMAEKLEGLYGRNRINIKENPMGAKKKIENGVIVVCPSENTDASVFLVHVNQVILTV